MIPILYYCLDPEYCLNKKLVELDSPIIFRSKSESLIGIKSSVIFYLPEYYNQAQLDKCLSFLNLLPTHIKQVIGITHNMFAIPETFKSFFLLRTLKEVGDDSSFFSRQLEQDHRNFMQLHTIMPFISLPESTMLLQECNNLEDLNDSINLLNHKYQKNSCKINLDGMQ